MKIEELDDAGRGNKGQRRGVRKFVALLIGFRCRAIKSYVSPSKRRTDEGTECSRLLGLHMMKLLEGVRMIKERRAICLIMKTIPNRSPGDGDVRFQVAVQYRGKDGDIIHSLEVVMRSRTEAQGALLTGARCTGVGATTKLA